MAREHGYSAVFGDLHNHCDISYGHGGLGDALANAALRLDFVSITGHADWPDMDTHDPRIAHIVDFHQKGFAKLRTRWDSYLEEMASFEEKNGLVTYPGYEIHSNEHGDYTIVGRDHDLAMSLADSPDNLRAIFKEKFGLSGILETATGTSHQITELPAAPPVMLFPHHIGYRRGARGVNWESFSEELSPLVEIHSMHGLADTDRSDKPSLHSMGPWQHYGTMEHGLAIGKMFGVIGNTDHHSGHPGSYGHGLAGAWSVSRDRSAVWDALYSRRTWAMTGDAARLWFSVGETPMGGETAKATVRPGHIAGRIDVDSTAAIDYVELRANGARQMVWWETPPSGETDEEAIVELELGWGERGKVAKWEVSIVVTNGEVLEVVPRFRGPEVVSPLDVSGQGIPTHHTNLGRHGNSVRFTTTTWGNMTNSTPSTQGLALRVSSPQTARLEVVMNGRRERRGVGDLLQGSISGNLGPIDSPAYRLCAIAPRDYRRSLSIPGHMVRRGWMNVRVRLSNGHWIISSPIRVS